MLPAVDRICPLLALGTDRRVVCAAYEPDHRCTATGGPDALSRLQQASVCLDPAHRECQHFVRAAHEAVGGRIPGVPPPSPDVVLAPMRLVIDGESAWSSPRRPAPVPAGRVMAAGVLALAAVGAVATGAAQRLAGAVTGAAPVARAPEPYVAPAVPPSSTPSQTPVATSAASDPSSSASALVQPTSAPPTPVPTAAAQPQTYVVQEGDTLQAIAQRFGTTIAAVKAANDIKDEDLIEAGQVLTLP